MGKKLYVGNLSYSLNDQSLSDLFAEAGTVESARIIMDQMTGRSKGFGFVEMSTDTEAQAALEKFNNMDCGGRALKVSEARPAPSRGERGGFGGGQRSFGGARRF